MAPGLEEIGKESFASGMWRAVARHKIPRDGVYDAVNALLDDDGLAYRRGPASRLAASQVVGAPVMPGLWDLSCLPGRRTVFSGTNYIGYLSGSTPVVITGLSIAASPGPVAKVGDCVFIPGTNSVGYLYAGSLKSAGASGGSVTITPGSAVVTQPSGDWRPNIDVGMLLSFSTGKRWYVVKSVDSATQITLTTPVFSDEPGGASSLVYVPVATLLAPNNNASSTRGRCGKAVAAVANKLWIAEGRRVYQSLGPDPGPGTTVGVVRPMDFAMDGTTLSWYHEFSSDVIALAGLRDRLFVFCEDGLYVISGCALDLVDEFGNAQQRIERITDEVLVRSAAGVALGSDVIVAAGRDGCYRIDSLGQVETLSRSIAPYWQAATQAGAAPGMPTIYRKHVFVPLNGEVLVCRVDRPRRSQIGVVYPWTRATGYLGGCRSFAVKDPTGSTKLIAGSSDGYVLDATGIFATGTAEGDGTIHQMTLESGEFVPAGGGEVHVRALRVDHEIAGAGATLGASFARGELAAPGGVPQYSALTGAAPENYTTQKPYTFAVEKAARRFSVRLVSAGDSIQACKVRGWAAAFRAPGRFR